jgi:hypothetical protein
MNIPDLAIDIASISDLKDLPLKIVKLTDELTEKFEQAQEKIEIDFGGVVVSIFHRNCPYKLDSGELKSGWALFVNNLLQGRSVAGACTPR